MKQRDNTSELYNYFQTNANFVNCKICRKKLKFYGNTKNLKSHLERIHPAVLKTEQVHQGDADTEEGSNHNKANRQPSRSEVLSLHAKVAAINFYDKYPVYSTVARHFPCTAKYIEGIIDSRDEILEEWNKQTREISVNEQKILFVGQVTPVEHRKLTQREIQVLNNEIDVWLRGCMNDRNFVATDELLEAKAIELQKLYNLKNIVPDADWISSIREKYDLKNGEDRPSDAPEADISLSQEDTNLPSEDQIREIRKNDRMPQTLVIDPLNKPSTWNVRKWRILRLELLNESMFEWVLRMQARGNERRLKRDFILQTAQEANKHVKVPKLKPHKNWLNKFRLRYNLTTESLKTRRLYEICGENKKHLSLEIPDIVDFVRQKKNSRRCNHQTVTEEHRYRIAYSDLNCGGDVEDIVPVDGDIIGDDDVPIKCEEDLDDEMPVMWEDLEDDVPVKSEEDVDDNVRVKCEEDVEDDVPVKCEEDVEEDVPVKWEEDVDDEVPVRCEEDVEIVEDINPMDGDLEDEDEVDEEEYVPKKMKRLETHYSRDNKNTIKSDEEALRYLKALENFVLLEENFRAIGVISQLEAVFRNPGNAS